MVLVNLLFWGPLPVAWLWVGSQVQYRTGSIVLRHRRRFAGLLAGCWSASSCSSGSTTRGSSCGARRATTSATGVIGPLFAVTAVGRRRGSRLWLRLHRRARADRCLGQQRADGPARPLPAVRGADRGGGQRASCASEARRAPPPGARARRAARPLAARRGPSSALDVVNAITFAARRGLHRYLRPAAAELRTRARPPPRRRPGARRRRRRRRAAAGRRGRAALHRARRRARHAVALLPALSRHGAARARPGGAGPRLRRRRVLARGHRPHARRRDLQPQRPDRRAAAPRTSCARCSSALPERVVVLLDEALPTSSTPSRATPRSRCSRTHPRLLVFRTLLEGLGPRRAALRLRDRRPGRRAAARRSSARAGRRRARAGGRAGGAARAAATARAPRRGTVVRRRARAPARPRCATLAASRCATSAGELPLAGAPRAACDRRRARRPRRGRCRRARPRAGGPLGERAPRPRARSTAARDGARPLSERLAEPRRCGLPMAGRRPAPPRDATRRRLAQQRAGRLLEDLAPGARLLLLGARSA